MIDLHCHVLPGLDDGPNDLEEALDLCRVAFASGTRTLVATPHVGWSYPAVGPTTVHAGVAQLNVSLREAGIGVTVLPGAEIALSKAGELSDGDLGVLRLGGSKYLLIECPRAAGSGIEQVLHQLTGRGHRIVLAHPERTPILYENRELLEELRQSGILCCLTAGSLVGHFGRQAESSAWEMLEAGLVHVVASDAHGPDRRPPDLRPKLERAGLEPAQIDYFTSVAPQCLLSGDPLDEPPTVLRRRRWRLLQRRS